MLKKLLLSLTLGTSLFAMHNASIDLNSDDLELKANIDMGEINQSDYTDMYYLSLGLLDVDNKEKTTSLLSAGFMLRQDLSGMQGFKFGIGFIGRYTKVGESKHASVPFNAELVYRLPVNFAMPIVMSGTVSYAPSVLSFKDAKKYFESRAELGLQIIEQGTLFVGYRKVETDFDNADYTYNDAGYVGFKVKF